MGQVLVIFAHPAFQRSRVNRALIKAASTTEGVTVHDAVVFQHPFFWYSSPALIKEWLDLVLEYRWAYGEGGDALRGKIMAQAISAGGPIDAYHREGFNYFTVRELLAPYEQTARLCGMGYAEAFAVHGTNHLDDPALADFARSYSTWLTALRDGSAPLWLPPPD